MARVAQPVYEETLTIAAPVPIAAAAYLMQAKDAEEVDVEVGLDCLQVVVDQPTDGRDRACAVH